MKEEVNMNQANVLADRSRRVRQTALMMLICGIAVGLLAAISALAEHGAIGMGVAVLALFAALGAVERAGRRGSGARGRSR
jgi:hypothetical protein